MVLFSFLLSILLGASGALIISNHAGTLGLIDRPNERSSHAIPTPKGGGIGILGAFILSSIFINLPISIWIPASLLSLVSLFGDKLDITPKLRITVQFAAACLFLVPFLFSGPSYTVLLRVVLYLVFFSVFIVGTANFFNFMDGINGIAGITGVVGFGLLALSNHMENGEVSFTVLPICIALACLGFLPFNMPKARVFMGDVGSILLGFVFALIVIILSNSLIDFICMAGFLFPFYADELITMFIRIKNGDNLIKPHRLHLYQLLANEFRIAHFKISVGYGTIQLFVGLTFLFTKRFGIVIIISLLIVYFMMFSVFTLLVHNRLKAS